MLLAGLVALVGNGETPNLITLPMKVGVISFEAAMFRRQMTDVFLLQRLLFVICMREALSCSLLQALGFKLTVVVQRYILVSIWPTRGPFRGTRIADAV